MGLEEDFFLALHTYHPKNPPPPPPGHPPPLPPSCIHPSTFWLSLSLVEVNLWQVCATTLCVAPANNTNSVSLSSVSACHVPWPHGVTRMPSSKKAIVEMPLHAHGPVPSNRLTPLWLLTSSGRHRVDFAVEALNLGSITPFLPTLLAPRNREAAPPPPIVKVVGFSSESKVRVCVPHTSMLTVFSPFTDHLPGPHGDVSLPPTWKRKPLCCSSMTHGPNLGNARAKGD